MPPLTKEDIKDVFVETLEPFVKAVQEDFGVIKKELKETRSELKETRSELKDEIAGVKFDLTEVKNDVKWMKENSSELFTKLDKFISLYQEERQERTVLATQVSRLEERVNQLEARMRKD